MMAAILNSAILDSTILKKKKTSLIHSHSTWWWQPSWILPCWIQPLPSWIQTPCYLLSDSLKNTFTPLWLWLQTNSIWLKLIHSDSTWWWEPSWISAIMDWAILFSLQATHTYQVLVPTICTKKTHSFILTQLDWFHHSSILADMHKKTSLIHSHWTWWLQPSWILPCLIHTLPCIGFRHLVIWSCLN